MNPNKSDIADVAARLVGRKIVGARVVVCDRPYATDYVLDLDDGTSVSFCGEYDESTVLREGDHGGIDG